MDSPYVAWLQKQGVALFKSTDTYWRLYNGGLVPASPTPCFLELTPAEARELLKESRAWFLRYSSHPSERETAWWYTFRDAHCPGKYSANTRSKVSRGHRHCEVRAIDADWLARYGYETYRSAHARYRNAIPLSQETFYKNVTGSAGGPFDYWGVFVGQDLAAYCQCIVEGNNVDTSVTRFHPVYLKHYSSYALIDFLINYYVIERRANLSNGDRSIVHDTNFQDFLLKMGFQKKFCRLNVAYQPVLKTIVKSLFPFRKIIATFPDRGLTHKVSALLLQEELKRQCR